MSLEMYLKKLASKSPAPGGGSAAALVGAIGISLLSMVARYANKRKGRRGSSAKLSGTIRFTEKSRRRLQGLMKEDEKTYQRLVSRRKKLAAKEVVELYKDAAEVPVKVCETLNEGLKRCAGLSADCGMSIASDLVEAAILMEAGFLSAKATAEINLRYIGGTAYAKKTSKALLKLQKSVSRFKKKVLHRKGARRWRRS